MTQPLPECLTKRGITRVESNLQPGQRISPDMSLLFRLLQEPILQATTTPAAQHKRCKT